MAVNKMQLEDWLDDLCVRFIINLPEEDLSTVARICFQIEEAQWFYEDFIRPLDPTLPSMTLRTFSLRIFQHCPLLAPFSVENHTLAFEEFLQYKTRVPVRGAIMLNEAMDSTVLVKGWKKGANWSFPRGKINKDEDDLECAIREVYEETGFDIHAAGLVPADRNVKFIEITMREQQMRLYVFRDVPMDTAFAPRTRKEISKIEWYRLSDLPAFRKKGANNTNQNDAAVAANANKFYMVAPFLVPLKKWVVQQKKREGNRSSELQVPSQTLYEEPVTEDDAWAQSHGASQAVPSMPAQQQKPGIDTFEGANKELQRLLNIQPTAALAAPAEAPSDKGASLLAILQASGQGSGGQAAPAPHTPLDHIISAPSQPPRPHDQHHPVPHAQMNNYQGPPSYQIQAHQAQQQWNQHAQVPQTQHQHPQQQFHQHVHMTPPHGPPQPTLRHPQPLPPPVHIDRGSFLNTPPPAGHQPAQAAQAVQAGPNPPLSGQQFPQHMVQQGQQQPRQLSNHSMALLNAFTSNGGAQRPNPSADKPAQISHELPAQESQQQRPGQGPTWQQTIPVHSASGGTQPGRMNPVTPQQRATLLNMFAKKAENTAPAASQGPQSAGEAFLKQKLAMGNPHGQVVPGHGPEPRVGRDALPQQGAHSQAGGQQPPNPAYRILQRTENLDHRGAAQRTPLLHQAVAGYASHEKPSSLNSPPATSSLPTPAGLHRKESMSHEQKNKLLSLFGKPQSASPASAAANEQGRGRELLPPNASPHSVASGPSSHVSDSRRGSQTPISPADRSFLLNYLASATGRAQ